MPTLLDHKTLARVTTLAATPTTCGTYTLADETSVLVRARVLGRQQASTNANAYVITAAVKREAAGAAAQLTGSPVVNTSYEDAAAWAAVIGVSGNDVVVTVTGVAATNIDWMVFLEIMVFTP